MKFIISQEVLENLLNYISKKPYCEVAPLMAEVQADIKPIEEKTEED